ncbi:MAG: hypothetical protein IPF87_10585 [Gemmatimonadetes bacterium]|nr:hypothetical protein [Gemmatimonadota bacterium]
MTLRSTPNNVPKNVLPAGMKDEALVDAIIASGYPLQGLVAASLLGEFGVVEEWDYIDDDSKLHRNLDLMAWRRLTPTRESSLAPELRLLIECKKSRQPYVFFRSVTESVAPRFPAFAGLSRDLLTISTPAGAATADIHPTSLLCLQSDHYVLDPPACSVMSRAYPKGEKVDLSGSEAYSDLVLPLTKGLRHLQVQLRPERDPWRPTVVLLVAVLDAPMLLVESPTEAGDPSFCPWVRVVRREPQETIERRDLDSTAST